TPFHRKSTPYASVLRPSGGEQLVPPVPPRLAGQVPRRQGEPARGTREQAGHRHAVQASPLSLSPRLTTRRAGPLLPTRSRGAVGCGGRQVRRGPRPFLAGLPNWTFLMARSRFRSLRVRSSHGFSWYSCARTSAFTPLRSRSFLNRRRAAPIGSRS